MAPAGGVGAIGPFPERVGDDPAAQEDYDRLRRRVLWTMPSGLYVVGSRDGERRNLMTLNWATQVAQEPKLVAIAVENTALTHGLIDGGRAFTLSMIAREDRAIVRKFTKPVDFDAAAGTANGFAVVEAASGMPRLAQAAAWLDCRLVRQLATGDHTLFVGEVVDCDFGDDEEPEVLRMEDTRMSYGG